MPTSTLFSINLNCHDQGEAALEAFTTYYSRQGLLVPLKKQPLYGFIELIQETSCGVSAELILNYDDEGWGATFSVDLHPPEGEVHRSDEFLNHLHGALKDDAADALKASFMTLGPESSMSEVCGLARCLAHTDVGALEVLERTDQGLVCRHFEDTVDDEGSFVHGTIYGVITLPFSSPPTP